MKKNPGLRAKRDQHKAHGKLVHVAAHEPDEVDDESDEDGGEAVRIFNSVLSKQPRAFMIRVGKEECSTPGDRCTSTRVLQIEGEDYEFELLTEDEMQILAEVPDETSPNFMDVDLSKLQNVYASNLISILPAPQIQELGASNLGD